MAPKVIHVPLGKIAGGNSFGDPTVCPSCKQKCNSTEIIDNASYITCDNCGMMWPDLRNVDPNTGVKECPNCASELKMNSNGDHYCPHCDDPTINPFKCPTCYQTMVSVDHKGKPLCSYCRPQHRVKHQCPKCQEPMVVGINGDPICRNTHLDLRPCPKCGCNIPASGICRFCAHEEREKVITDLCHADVERLIPPLKENWAKRGITGKDLDDALYHFRSDMMKSLRERYSNFSNDDVAAMVRTETVTSTINASIKDDGEGFVG
jgi:hypothetical protein